MDLSKAYDCLSHDLPIAKLPAYGFDDNTTLVLIIDYLTYLLQRVKTRSTFSSYLEVLKGIPQRSISGPGLFNLLINDLMFFIKETYVCMFDNDTNIYLCSLNYEEAHLELSNDTHIVLNWFRINSIAADPGDFQMFLGSLINDNNITFEGFDKIRKFLSQQNVFLRLI